MSGAVHLNANSTTVFVGMPRHGNMREEKRGKKEKVGNKTRKRGRKKSKRREERKLSAEYIPAVRVRDCNAMH